MLRTFKKCLCLLAIILTASTENIAKKSEKQQEITLNDDAIIVEAEPIEQDRNGRQAQFFQGSWAQALGEGATCLSSLGLLGSCMSFQHCYPYYKLPSLGYFDPFLFGNYDTCTFFTPTGQQAFGVCCTNPVTFEPGNPAERPEMPSNPPISMPTVEEQHPSMIGNGDNVTNMIENDQDTKYQNWPPPIPTHPPLQTSTTFQWPPPIPTHPPNHHAPTHPSKPGSTRPPTTFPSWPPQAPTHPPTSFPSWPPTRPPSYPPPSFPSWPPTQPPSYPPASFPSWPPTQPPSYPPAIPTRPPFGQWPPAIPTQPPSYPPPVTTRPPSYPPPVTTRPPSYPPPTTTKPPSQPGTDNFQAQCGAKNGVLDQERIVGGQSASPNEWPWIVVLFNGGRQFCGGSLLDNLHILTAAHCVAHMSSWDVARLKAHLGDHNIKSNTEVQHVERAIKRVVRHRGFDSRTLYNDVAILTMDKPVEYSRTVKPICLPSGGSAPYTGKVATVIGWGSLKENGQQPAILQKVSIPIWTNRDCAQKYGPAAPGGIIDSMLCAGQDSRDSCSGDSGGPLMINEGRWTQVGIVSWGIGCGKGQYPGVYSRITHFLPWIQKNLEGNI